MLGCFNQSWKEGVLPQAWRRALIVPLLKSGKAPGEVDSFRPISLTSCLGKWMERMVANRLSHLAEEGGMLVEEQAGFRRLRSTEDQVLQLSQSISDGFQEKPPLRAVLALLDYSKAYDTVWRSELLNCLLNAGVPYRLTRWIKGFLTNRLIRVRYGSGISSTRQVKNGLPQGSVLSPLLFLFFINGLRERLSRECTVSLYADDVALLRSHKDKVRAASDLEGDVNEAWRWSREKKLTLNLKKCEVSFFSPDSREASWEPQVRVEGRQLPFNPNPVFLGVQYNRTLSFRPQAERVARGLMGDSRLLAAIGNQEWGWRGGLLRRVYQAVSLGKIGYCGAAWQPWLAPTSVNLLESAQNRCLRAITGLHLSSPVEALRKEAGIPSVHTSIRRSTARAWERSLRLPESALRRQLADRQVRQRTTIRGNWRVLVRACVHEAGLSEQPRLPFPPPTSAPWEWEGGNWSVFLSLRGGSARTDDARLADALDTIRALAPLDFVIYTDGSAEGGVHRGGSAAVVCSGGDPESAVARETLTRAGAEVTSSFDAEVGALEMATEWLSRRGSADLRVAICTDSRASLEALDSRRVSGPLGLVLRRLRAVECHVLF